MTIKTPLAPSWSLVGVLVLIIALLAALVVLQWRRAITAPLRAENAALTEALDRSNDIAERRDRDDAKLLKDLQGIADRGQRVRVEYRNAADAQPLASECAPGQQRVDAINRALGAPVGEQP